MLKCPIDSCGRTFLSRGQFSGHLAHVHESAASPGEVKEGMFVSWSSSGGRSQGRVEHVMTEGQLGVPGSRFSLEASPDDPAALVRVWQQGPDGWIDTEVLVGHRVSTLTVIEPLDDSYDNEDESAEAYRIPSSVASEAKRGLSWRSEYGRGGTDVGLNTARTLAAGGTIGIAKARHIARYFPRHEVDKQGTGWSPGESGYPSNGRIAWALWGGDPGRSWANRIVARANKES